MDIGRSTGPMTRPQASGYPINEVSTRLGLTPRALRYYEEVGLVRPGRNRQNKRVYPEAALRSLETIALLRRGGVDVETITWVLEADDLAARADRMTVAAARRLEALDAQKQVLRALVEPA